jgi:hypothetical protein
MVGVERLAEMVGSQKDALKNLFSWEISERSRCEANRGAGGCCGTLG